MKPLAAWTTHLTPLAPSVGPFPLPPFIREAAALEGEEPVVFEHDHSAMILTMIDGTVRFAGHEDLTDYHSPFGDDPKAMMIALVEALGPGVEVSLDSLPAEAADPMEAALQSAGMTVGRTRHEAAAVVPLPDSFDDYLQALGKKQRHEVRRKRRRYEESVGERIHEVHHGAGWAFDEFVRLHRLSEGEKGQFMTDEYEAFFRHLAEMPGWRVDVLRVPGSERASACLFCYSDDDAVYLYNGSYDPGMAEASPGVAIVGSMIEQAIEEGLSRFDFLKGDEEYKYRLGAVERPLYRLETRT